jgi:hypothetical protein
VILNVTLEAAAAAGALRRENKVKVGGWTIWQLANYSQNNATLTPYSKISLD